MKSGTKLPFFSTAVIVLVLLAAGITYTVLSDGGSATSPPERPPASDAAPRTSTPASEVDPTGKAPDFQLKRMNGEVFQLSDHYGKVIVLNFWATWCPPCRKEIPDFIEMQDEYRQDGLLFVGVAEDEKGWKVVRPFARKMKINYPIVVDDGTVASKYGGIRGLPTSFIIGRDGEIHHVVPGMMPRELLESELTKLLADAEQ